MSRCSKQQRRWVAVDDPRARPFLGCERAGMNSFLFSITALRVRTASHALAVLAVILAAVASGLEAISQPPTGGGGGQLSGNGLEVAVCALAAASIVSRDDWQRSLVSSGSLWLNQLARLLLLSAFQLSVAQVAVWCLTGSSPLPLSRPLELALAVVLAAVLGLSVLRLQQRWRVGALLVLAGSAVLPALPRMEFEAFNVAARAFDFLAPLRWMARSSDTLRVASCYVATVLGLLGLAWLLPRPVAR